MTVTVILDWKCQIPKGRLAATKWPLSEEFLLGLADLLSTFSDEDCWEGNPCLIYPLAKGRLAAKKRPLSEEPLLALADLPSIFSVKDCREGTHCGSFQ